jgi:anti-sigma factor RsiW
MSDDRMKAHSHHAPCPECNRRLEALRALVRELAQALDIFADADDSLEVADLITRARAASPPIGEESFRRHPPAESR